MLKVRSVCPDVAALTRFDIQVQLHYWTDFPFFSPWEMSCRADRHWCWGAWDFFHSSPCWACYGFSTLSILIHSLCCSLIPVQTALWLHSSLATPWHSTACLISPSLRLGCFSLSPHSDLPCTFAGTAPNLVLFLLLIVNGIIFQVDSSWPHGLACKAAVYLHNWAEINNQCRTLHWFAVTLYVGLFCTTLQL